LPILLSQVFFASAQSHNSFLILDISPFANDRLLHLVERPLEEPLVLFDEQSPDGLQLSLALSD
jgi:hypothetical protein